MPYPTIQQYKNVLQLPKGQRSVKSPELDGVRNGEILPSKNPQYLHWGSGSFAVVFRCKEQGNSQVAVRCLLCEPPSDMTERCTELESFRRSHAQNVPFLVRSQFEPDAIKVQGEWYPLFLMEWIEGRTLGAHVADVIKKRDKNAMSALADRWQELIVTLKKLGFAHGDLQHGNVMVTSKGELRLVDYDTVFVPALAHKNAVAVGTPGYVHPAYLESGQRPYNESMDTFGALVILLSLRALANQPNLYGQFTQDNLLLSAEDLEKPDNSQAFQHLRGISDPDIADLTQQLYEACRRNTEPALNFPVPEPLGPAIPRVRTSPPTPIEYEPGTLLRRGVGSGQVDVNYEPGATIPRTSPIITPDDYKPGEAIRKS